MRPDGLGPTNAVKASSTTSEFTKRKNWSQHIIDEMQVSPLFFSESGRGSCGGARRST